MKGEFNMLVAGVGGQGVILISELLGSAAVSDGLVVRGSEILGMAVRGGSVVSVIRIGADAHGPLIPEGKGDLVIAMEASEALRNAAFIAESGSVVVNTERVTPVGVSLGQGKYPELEKIIGKLKARSGRVVAVDAAKLAREAGSELSANLVMLGAACGVADIPIKADTIKAAIREQFSAALAPINLAAFSLGYDIGRSARNEAT